MESRVSQAVMVIRQSPTTVETMLMNPGMDSISMAILRPLSRMMATSSALRAKKLVILNAPGSAVLPLLARTLVPNPKGPIEEGCTMTSSPKARGTAPLSKYPCRKSDLATFGAGEVGSGERDRTARRWQAHHGAGVGALHEPLG